MRHFEQVEHVVKKHMVLTTLSPHPVVFSIPYTEGEFVAWRGMVVPRPVALSWVGSMIGVYPSPSVKAGLNLMIRHYIDTCAYGPGLSSTWTSYLREGSAYAAVTRMFNNKSKDDIDHSTANIEEVMLRLAPGTHYA